MAFTALQQALVPSLSLAAKSSGTASSSSSFSSLRICAAPGSCMVARVSSKEGYLLDSMTTSAPESDSPSYFLSGEWPDNFSILNYEDLCKHYEPLLLKEGTRPDSFLADVMSEIRYFARPDQLLEEVDSCFLDVSGLPVVDTDSKCIGVFSKKDRAKASKGLQSTVAEVMTTPAVSLTADKTVNDAAILMLKNKIHRIPIVNEADQLVGMVTRTDIFKALQGEN
ncbi:hypothetical protein KP509_30G021900 [Ceratopteris richardii]|uniref:CBS domain-containing protein n=2 Tax=Ceratopteris richardii TaxID=49495 RepID=A0A8T2R232_CERRI|nr:hypothetical protein KP509_30G021900 [Ceratopteris richardii]